MRRSRRWPHALVTLVSTSSSGISGFRVGSTEQHRCVVPSDDVRCAGNDVVGRCRSFHDQVIVRGRDAVGFRRRPKGFRGLRLLIVQEAPARINAVKLVSAQACLVVTFFMDGLREKDVKMGIARGCSPPQHTQKRRPSGTDAIIDIYTDGGLDAFCGPEPLAAWPACRIAPSTFGSVLKNGHATSQHDETTIIGVPHLGSRVRKPGCCWNRGL